MYIAENLKSLRKSRDWTQEDVAEILGVSPQSVSKWERGETYPDITLLPALANLYKVSVDAIIGMEKINTAEAKNAIYLAGYEHMRRGDRAAAEKVHVEALKSFPGDEGLMSQLAMILALGDDPVQLSRAVELCERVLSGNPSEKVRHTTRAVICFIYLKLGDRGKSIAAAKNLPHARESRENVLAEIEGEPTVESIDAYLKFIFMGE